MSDKDKILSEGHSKVREAFNESLEEFDDLYKKLATDAEFERQMKLADKIMDQDRELLKKLADS